MFRITISILFACILNLICTEASAQRRVALVIGNSAYQHVGALANPAGDAASVSATLKDAGFDVVSLRDLKVQDMRLALRNFADIARNADIAIIYFAGHGMEIDHTNYVIPVDAVLNRDIDAYDEAITLDHLQAVIEPAKRLRLIILDACRDNPFNKTMQRTIGSRAVSRGFAKVEPSNPNTLVAFASKAGSLASDGDDGHSPFTAALVKYIATPGLDLRRAFGYIRDEVLKNTGNAQEPYLYGSLGGDDVPLVPGKVAAAEPPADPQTSIRRDYELALQLGTREGWNAFLARFSDSFYSDLAKGQLKKIDAEEARVAATEKARLAADEQKRLEAEGAKKAEQTKAAEEARTAEQARLTAEANKTIEDARVAEGERVKLAAQAKADADEKGKPQNDAMADDAIRTRIREEIAEDERAYRQAGDNVDLLKNYAQDCKVCAYKTAALQAAEKLADEARLFMLKVCNKSSRKASVAVMGRTATESNDLHVEGWWSVPSGKCNNIKRYVKGTIYLFAQEDGNPSFAWKGHDRSACVALPGPFDRVNSDGRDCQGAEKAVVFSAFTVSDATFTWNLNSLN